jgi:hypothetical protein
MGYTTIQNVAGMFPTFQRGTPQQKPGDSLIQQYIDDCAAEIDAALVGRGFVAPGLANSQIQPLLSPGALNICELINRMGAAKQLGETLATFGLLGAREMAAQFSEEYARLQNSLAARDDQGRPLAAGPYDRYFDPQARTVTSEPGLRGIAGGDQPAGQKPSDVRSSAAFGKFDPRGT